MLMSFIAPWFESYPIIAPALLAQSSKNWELILIHDGPPSGQYRAIMNYYEQFENISFHNTDKRYNDFGHTPREYGLTKVDPKSDLTVFTAADSYYMPLFVEFMEMPFHRQRTIAAYCNFLSWYKLMDGKMWNQVFSQLRFRYIDCGNFVIRTSIAKEIGWKDRVMESDWKFIEKVINKYGERDIVKVEQNLYVHN